MADSRPDQLNALAGADVAADDSFLVYDLSAGTLTKMTRAEMLAALAVPGTTFQPLDADLTAIAGLTSAADKGIQFTGSGTAGVFDLLSGAWSDWTPTLSGGWASGNATDVSGYARVGRMIFFYTVITTGSTTTYGSGLTIALPVTAAANAPVCTMTCQLLDTGTNTWYGVIHSNTTTTMTIRTPKVSTTYFIADNVAATSPFTWTTGDGITVAGFYEAAA